MPLLSRGLLFQLQVRKQEGQRDWLQADCTDVDAMYEQVVLGQEDFSHCRGVKLISASMEFNSSYSSMPLFPGWALSLGINFFSGQQLSCREKLLAMSAVTSMYRVPGVPLMNNSDLISSLICDSNVNSFKLKASLSKVQAIVGAPASHFFNVNRRYPSLLTSVIRLCDSPSLSTTGYSMLQGSIRIQTWLTRTVAVMLTLGELLIRKISQSLYPLGSLNTIVGRGVLAFICGDSTCISSPSQLSLVQEILIYSSFNSSAVSAEIITRGSSSRILLRQQKVMFLETSTTTVEGRPSCMVKPLSPEVQWMVQKVFMVLSETQTCRVEKQLLRPQLQVMLLKMVELSTFFGGTGMWISPPSFLVLVQLIPSQSKTLTVGFPSNTLTVSTVSFSLIPVIEYLMVSLARPKSVTVCPYLSSTCPQGVCAYISISTSM